MSKAALEADRAQFRHPFDTVAASIASRVVSADSPNPREDRANSIFDSRLAKLDMPVGLRAAGQQE